MPRPPVLVWFGMFLAMLMAFLLAREKHARPRRLWATASLLLASSMLLAGLSGCNTTPPETAPGTYTVHVKVTVGNDSVVVPFTVTVTK